MELNKKKYREYIVNVLNDEFDTYSFTVNTNKDTKDLYHIFSDTLSTAVYIDFNFDNVDETVTLENIVRIVQETEKDTSIKDLIFVIYRDLSMFLDDFYIFVDDNYRLDVDVWDKVVLNERFESFQSKLSEKDESFEINSYELNDVPEIAKIDSTIFSKTYADLDNLFFKKKKQKCVLFNEMIGSGKTSAAIDYAISRKNKFAHIAYISVNNDLKIDFVNSFISEKINFQYNHYLNFFKNYYDLLSLLEGVDKNTLLIFDQISDIKEIAIVNEIEKSTGFKVLIVSTAKLLNFINIGLRLPTDEQILKVVKSYLPKIDNSIILPFFDAIDNNLFFANFLGKQIKNNKKLKINSIFNDIEDKMKKVYRLNTYIDKSLPVNTVLKHQNLLKFIMSVYEAQVKDLSAIQKKILVLLTALPQIKMTYNDLINYLNVRVKQTDNFVNEFLDLQKRGWIETTKDNIFVNNNVKKILHKKLKPSSRNLSAAFYYLSLKLYNEEITDLNFLIAAETITHNIVSFDANVADLSKVISEVYSKMGYFDRVVYYSEIAANIYEELLVSEVPTLGYLDSLIKLFMLAKKNEKALYYNQQAYQLCIDEYGENSEELVNYAINMALILEGVQDYYNAIAYIEKAIDILQEIYDPEAEEMEFPTQLHSDISQMINSQADIKNFDKFFRDFFD